MIFQSTLVYPHTHTHEYVCVWVYVCMCVYKGHSIIKQNSFEKAKPFFQNFFTVNLKSAFFGIGLWTKLLQSRINIFDGWLVGWLGFLWHINLYRLFNAKFIFMKIVRFQTIQFKIRTQFKYKYSLIVKFLFQAIQLSQAVLNQIIQFSISTDFVNTQLNVKTVLY